MNQQDQGGQQGASPPISKPPVEATRLDSSGNPAVMEMATAIAKATPLTGEDLERYGET